MEHEPSGAERKLGTIVATMGDAAIQTHRLGITARMTKDEPQKLLSETSKEVLQLVPSN